MVLVRVEEKKHIFSFLVCLARCTPNSQQTPVVPANCAPFKRKTLVQPVNAAHIYQGYEVVTARVKRDVVFSICDN